MYQEHGQQQRTRLFRDIPFVDGVAKPIGVYYEHPTWFRPLFEALDRRGIAWQPIRAHDPEHEAADAGGHYSVILNRMSPSAWERGRGDTVLGATEYLARLEEQGVPVLNGSAAYQLDINKGAQIELLDRLGIHAPRTRAVRDPKHLVIESEGMIFPLLVKPNNGGNGAGIRRFTSRAQLQAAVDGDSFVIGPDGVLLLQEYHAPRGRSIVRAETLGGRFLYAIRMHFGDDDGFSLCPADVCHLVGGERLTSSARSDHASNQASVEHFTPPQEAIDEIERIASGAGLDMGGVEYLISERDGERYYYDINGLSNFVADPLKVIGFDPTERLVDLLQERRRAAAIA